MNIDHADDRSSNPSSNQSIQDLIDQAVSRRSVLKSGLGAAAVSFLAGSWLTGCNDDDSKKPAMSPNRSCPGANRSMPSLPLG